MKKVTKVQSLNAYGLEETLMKLNKSIEEFILVCLLTFIS